MVEFREIKHEYEKPSDRVVIVPFSDLHVGNKAADKKRIRRTADWIAEYADYWFGGGDYCDCIVPSPNERRFDFDSLDRELATPDEQYRWVYDVFEPIRDKCVGLLTGNHDDVIRQRHSHNHVRELCDRLGVPYLSYSAMLRWRFSRGEHRTKLDLYAHHGKCAARTKGGKINKARTLDKIFDATVYCMSHVHDINPDVRPFLVFDKWGNIVEERKYYVLTGGFLRGYVRGLSTYVERGMYAPTILGSMFVEVAPEKNVFPWIKVDEVTI